ncbi:3-isopropylmalate dehydratase large subunit [Chlorella sorokiniana]|uniref:3-isopropylmalate dehydratase large subunit n=1 Tax=Chlorella sorokiniana TaxID=3076 RepID=A0A2P6TMJ3_CHLSO|nr:3-isopropylmalate dehydratase large subunit [Chlorella sorokiniana]|eukprot:PRW45553.1 3-isopropylmalate dehydratase large subunit [Chlorella sorokiniana]
MGHRLRRTAQRLTGLPEQRVELSLFANKATVQAVVSRGGAGSQPWRASLELLQAELVVVGMDKDAADLAMRYAMLLDAEQYGPETAILCVTNDQGFGETLACCGQFGALTVAVGTYLPRAGITWSQPPSQMPVPAAANCIVAFHPGRAVPVSKTEAKLVDRWEQRLGADQTLGPRRPHKGVCITRWLNPQRPLAQPAQLQ